jgi:hypothetical protein
VQCGFGSNDSSTAQIYNKEQRLLFSKQPGPEVPLSQQLSDLTGFMHERLPAACPQPSCQVSRSCVVLSLSFSAERRDLFVEFVVIL